MLEKAGLVETSVDVDLIEIEISTRRRYTYTKRINTRNDSERKYNENWKFFKTYFCAVF